MRQREAFTVLLAILTACTVLDPDPARAGPWRRGTAMTSLVPAAPTSEVQLVAEDVVCTLGASSAKVEAIYVLRNISDRHLQLKAGLWRYGSDYLHGVNIAVAKLLFRAPSPPSLAARQVDSGGADPLARLRPAFEEHGIPLSPKAALVEDEPARRWHVTDGKPRYTLEKSRDDVYVYGSGREVRPQMIEFENQAAYTGPDYLFSIEFAPAEQIRIEARCLAQLYFGKDGAAWFFYEGQHGRAWVRESEAARVRFVSPPEWNRRFLKASPDGYSKRGSAILWDDVSLIRRERCFARYAPNH